MKERPILFSARMVRQLLAGTKTQTRRPIRDDWWRCLDPEDEDDRAQALGMCPHGVVGDRLWVRETWAVAHESGENLDEAEKLDDARRQMPWACIVYRATDTHAEPERWRPSIFLPRWASRMTLEITQVRIECLHDITEADARAEGIALPEVRAICPCETKVNDPGPTHIATCAWRSLNIEPTGKRHVDEYAHLWDELNAKRAPWSSNPWVWRISFRRVS